MNPDKTTRELYIENVKSVLEAIPVDQVVKASYDTGFGLSLVDEDLGSSPMTLFVVQHRVAKILPPYINDSHEWDLAWSEAKRLVNEFIAERNA